MVGELVGNAVDSVFVNGWGKVKGSPELCIDPDPEAFREARSLASNGTASVLLRFSTTGHDGIVKVRSMVTDRAKEPSKIIWKDISMIKDLQSYREQILQETEISK